MFRRSHKDLGRNWSISLEIREEHKLVTRGVYSLIRHPMYTAFLLMAVGQAFLISNWGRRPGRARRLFRPVLPARGQGGAPDAGTRSARITPFTWAAPGGSFPGSTDRAIRRISRHARTPSRPDTVAAARL